MLGNKECNRGSRLEYDSGLLIILMTGPLFHCYYIVYLKQPFFLAMPTSSTFYVSVIFSLLSQLRQRLFSPLVAQHLFDFYSGQCYGDGCRIVFNHIHWSKLKFSSNIFLALVVLTFLKQSNLLLYFYKILIPSRCQRDILL